MAVNLKPFVEYVDPAPNWWESELVDYQTRPATAFLREAVHISDAIRQCRRRFQKRKNGTFNKDSQDSIYRLGAAALSSMMSHFETFQRSLFAGMMEATRFVPDFKLDECCKRLQRDSQLSIDATRVLAYRGRAAPIGQVVADSLGSWHSPQRVNSHFRAVIPDYQFLSGAESNQLDILWQLRHSIVHTGGWLTHADAQKLKFLGTLADKPILLNDNFVEAAARRLHGIVGRATSTIGARFLPKLSMAVDDAERAAVERLFEVQSPRRTWLKTTV